MKNDIFSGTEKEKQSLVYIRRAGNEQIKKPSGRAIQQCPDFCFIFPKSKKEGGTRAQVGDDTPLTTLSRMSLDPRLNLKMST